MVSDPELRRTNGGTAVCNAKVACDRSVKLGDKPALFIPVTFFGATAENVAKYFRKGRAIIVTGRLENDLIEDRNRPGEKTTIYYIDAKSFDFPLTETKKEKDETAATLAAEQSPILESGNTAAIDLSEDDLPF